MKRFFAILIALLIMTFSISTSYAVLPDEVLSDPALEARARLISKELRCVVCQNQSIDDSNAPLARDIRILVRERIKNGDTDQQVKDYLVARYGNFVLLRPPVQKNTLILWFSPLLFIFSAFIGFGLYLRNTRKGAGTDIQALSDQEKQQLYSIEKENE